MPDDKPQFPPPSEPLSLEEAVKKILADPGFAKFIHGEVLKARGGDENAAARVATHFRPLPEELTALKLKASDFTARGCTNPTTNLLDFAAHVK